MGLLFSQPEKNSGSPSRKSSSSGPGDDDESPCRWSSADSYRDSIETTPRTYQSEMEDLFKVYGGQNGDKLPGWKRSVQDLLYNGDKRKDQGEGYIYVFTLDGDPVGDAPYGRGMFKIGFTKDPKRRLKEWRKQYGDELVVFRSWQVKRARIAERTIHLLLANQRTRRWLIATRGEIHTEWFYKEQQQQHHQNILPKGSVAAKYKRYKKELEWFYCEPHNVVDICTNTVDIINNY